MKQFKKVFVFACALMAQSTFASIPAQKVIATSEALTAVEKLTGVRKMIPKKKSEKALMMARESRDQKNYVLAIKRYNYIIKNFSKSNEVRQALLDKSAIYQKMGFDKPAIYNLNKAKLISQSQKTTGQVVK